MSSFTSPLIVSPMPDGRNFKLYRSFKYHVGTKYSKNVISVPAGFVTDFASVPSLFWSFLPYWGRYGKAATLHDWLYHTRETTRKYADDIFYEAMLVGGTPKWQARLMYWSVRAFAWLAWKGKKHDRRRTRQSISPAG